MASDCEIVDPASVDREPFRESGVKHAKLTIALDAEALRVNQVTVDSGEGVGSHTHATGGSVCLSGQPRRGLSGWRPRDGPRGRGGADRAERATAGAEHGRGALDLDHGRGAAGRHEGDFGEDEVPEGGYESDS